MIRVRTIQWRAGVAAALVSMLAACTPNTPPIAVSEARAAATPPGASVGAAYLTIEAAQADRLLGAHTPIAARVEMHISSEADGMMRMRRIDGLALEPGVAQVLAPQGTHFMLIDLQSPLVAGANFPLTLQFERAGEMAIDVRVVAPDALVTH